MSAIKRGAVLLLLFILALSVSAIAAPEGISDLTIKGRDGVKGYVRGNFDTFHFIITARYGQNQINPSQVRLGGTSSTGGFVFDSCTPKTDGYECRLSRNMSGFVICPKTTFDINLYDSNGNFIDDDQAEVVCDTASPSLTASVDKAIYSSQDNVTISYSILDSAYSGSSSFQCSGISGQLRIVGGGFVKTYAIPSDGTCAARGSVQEVASVFNTGSNASVVSLEVFASDQLGNMGSGSLSFETDFTGLSFALAFFNITDLEHKEIKFFRPMDVLLDFAIDIFNEDFDESTLTANLSEIGDAQSNFVCSTLSDRRRCVWSNIRISLDKPSLSRIITVSGKDSIGNQKTQVITLTKSLPVDKTFPRIANFRIETPQGVPLNFTGKGSKQLRVLVDILEAETSLNTSSVRADLSALNQNTQFKNVPKDSCSALSANLTRCTFNAAAVFDTNGKIALPLVFSAADLSGNKVTESLVYIVEVDTEGPLPVLLHVLGQEPETLNYVSPNGRTLVLVLRDSGIGLSKQNVFLDATSLGNPRLAAHNCTKQDDFYTCYFYDVSAQISGRVFVSSSSAIQDLAGNAANGTVSLELEPDDVAPIIDSVVQSPQFPTYKDKIFFDVEARDAKAGIRRAYFLPGNLLNASELEFTCNSEDENSEEPDTNKSVVSSRNKVSCVLELTGLPHKAQSDNVKIIAEDFAGNTAEKVLLLEIAEPATGVTPDFFTSRVIGISPTRVPRKATGQIQFSIFGKTYLEPLQDVKVIGKKVDCANSSYVLANSAYILSEDSREPIITFKLTSAITAVAAPQITVTCSLSLKIKQGDKIYSKPEIEKLEFKIPLYDDPVGVVDEVVKAKLDAINEEIKDLEKEIKTKDKYAQILATWCTISKLLGQLNSVFANLKFLWYTVTNLQELAAIGQIDAALATGVGSYAGAIGAAGTGCGVPVTAAACCPVEGTLVGLSLAAADVMVEYQALSKIGSITAAPLASAIAGDFSAAAAASAGCPTTVVFSAVFGTAATTVVAGTASWTTAKTNFVSICKTAGWFHSFVDNFIWPPGPFGIGGPNIAKNPWSVIGMINKMGCAIAYQCALCDWDDWIDVSFHFFDKYFGHQVKSAVANFVGTNVAGQQGDQSNVGPDGNKAETKSTQKNSGFSGWLWSFIPGSPPTDIRTAPRGSGAADTSKTKLVTTIGTDGKINTDVKPVGQSILDITGYQIKTTVPSGSTYNAPQVTLRPDNNGWRNNILITDPPDLGQGKTWIWNPYKSKPYAIACLCYPPIVYNLKKERQVKCMYRNCLQKEIEAGVTTTACDLAYKERQCLYVDGAQFKLFGNDQIFDSLINAIASKLPWIVGGLIYQSVCGATYSLIQGGKCEAAFSQFISTAGKHPVACGLAGTLQTLLELKGVWDSIYGGFSYDNELKGTDYCGSGAYPTERRDY